MRNATVSSKTRKERLSDVHHVTLIMRFVLNEQGQILHGELVDPQSTGIRRFKAWNGLISALSAWLNDERRRS